MSSFSLEVRTSVPEDAFPANDFPQLPYHETYEAHDKRYREARDAGGSGKTDTSVGSEDDKDNNIGFFARLAEIIEGSGILQILLRIIIEILT